LRQQQRNNETGAHKKTLHYRTFIPLCSAFSILFENQYSHPGFTVSAGKGSRPPGP